MMGSNYVKAYKVASIIDAILPRSWDLGPPLPTYFQVSWPGVIKSEMPRIIKVSGDKFNVKKANLAYKVSGFDKALMK
jgi:hypothetical protein